MQHHAETWLTVLAIFRQRPQAGSVEMLIGELEAQLASGGFEPSLPETRDAIETILSAVCPDRFSRPGREAGAAHD